MLINVLERAGLDGAVAGYAQTGDHRRLGACISNRVNGMRVDEKQSSLSILSLPEGIPTATGTIKAQLDLLLLGLESLSGESSEAVLTAAKALGVSQWVSDRVNLWRLRNSSPLRRGTGGRKKVDIEEARALVLIIAYLAQQMQDKIRLTLEHLEAAVAAERSPYREPLVGDYLDEFHAHYRSRMMDGDDRSSDSMTELALRLLIELMFYSSKLGSKRLWGSLLTRPELNLPDQPEVESDESSQVSSSQVSSNTDSDPPDLESGYATSATPPEA